MAILSARGLQVEMLAALMATKRCDTVELF
jgi:hypothetical protein